jgi:quercetin dioxygenase-like cupin family protein
MKSQHGDDVAPRLSFLEPEQAGPGMLIHEIDLTDQSGPRAPFKASRFTVDPGCTSPVDSHAVREIWMVAEGEGELLYDGRPSRLKAADVVYFDSHKPHQVTNDGAQTLVVYSVWWSS